MNEKPIEAKDVIERLCKLTAEVYGQIGYGHAADCFCGNSGFWGCDKYDGTFANGYRNDGVCLEFIERTVREKLESMSTAVGKKEGQAK